MKKRLFLYLLKQYTQTEEDRVEVYKAVNQGALDEYYEADPYQNFYNSYLEFLISNPFIKQLIDYNNLTDSDTFKPIRIGLVNVLKEGVDIISEKNKV